jgi:hypothetical protein
LSFSPHFLRWPITVSHMIAGVPTSPSLSLIATRLSITYWNRQIHSYYTASRNKE